ncbi:MAG: flippase-like domain-containing protein [Microbacterium sp.]|nr:flippase-like domain-containing protein [Microbacterium sp.]
MSEPQSNRGRRLAGAALRIAFVAAVIGFAIWSFRDDWDAIGAAIVATPWWASAGAVLLMAAGVLLSVPMWTRLLRSARAPVPTRTASEVLLIGQLGKYLPGSVWTVAAQARLLRPYGLRIRASVAVGLLYIGVYLAISLLLGSIVLLAGGNPWGIPWWVVALVAAVCLLALTPWFLGLAARLVMGRAARFDLSWRGSAAILGTMILSWACWVTAPLLLATRGGLTWAETAAVTAAALIGYAAGVVVIVAPAGFGVREAVFIAFLSPVVGLPDAVALAVTSRLAGVIADFALAGAAWWSSRRERATPPAGPLAP